MKRFREKMRKDGISHCDLIARALKTKAKREAESRKYLKEKREKEKWKQNPRRSKRLAEKKAKLEQEKNKS